MAYKTVIMFPLNSTALIVGRDLINADHEVSLYSPDDVHKKLAHTIPADLEIEVLGKTGSVKQVETLEEFPSINHIIFPTLDVDPSESRSDFASLCKDLFR